MPILRPNPGEKQSSYISRCMGNPTMNEEYPDRAQKSAVCYSTWRNSNKNNMRLNTIGFMLNKVSIERTQFEGKSYTVVPVVLLVEGVHIGATGDSVYYSKKALRENYNKWNGIPTPLLHPKINTEEGEVYISANSPEVLDKNNVGRLFDVTYYEENELGKLKGKLYIDVDKVNRLYPSLLPMIESGKPVEVSTGLYSDDIYEGGEWNGKKYEIKAENIRPDHLALLPGSEGACNWGDGCGIRDNEKEEEGKGEDKNVKGEESKEPTRFNIKGEESMATKFKDRVDKIISNSSVYTEDNKEWLGSLEDCPLSKIEALVAKEMELVTVLNEKKEEKNVEEEKKVDVVNKVVEKEVEKPEKEASEIPLTLEQYIGQAPEEIRDVLSDGVVLRNHKKKILIQSILANKANGFPEVDLKDMTLPLLENIAKLAEVKTNSYEGRGGSFAPTSPSVPILEVSNCFSDNGGK